VSSWLDFMLQASYAGVEFDCLTADDSWPRSVVRRERPRVNGSTLQDMGLSSRSTHCRCIFWDRDPVDGEDTTQSSRSARQRFADFLRAHEAGGTHTFVHPITGAYQAMTEDLSASHDAEDPDVVYVDVTFVEDGDTPAVFDAGVSNPFGSGLAGATVYVDLLTDQLAAAGYDPDLATQARTLLDRWDFDPDLPIRDINLDLLGFAALIDTATERYELLTRVENMPILRTVHTLLFRMRQAAGARRQTQPQIVSLTLTRALPLRVLLAEYYGANEGARRQGAVERLNDIDDPSLLPPGTTILLEAREVGRQVARAA